LERRPRSDRAQQVIDQLCELVNGSDLDAAEKGRLQSALGNLRDTSLAAEIERFASLGSNGSNKIEGELLPDFLFGCLKLRHKLAHPPNIAAENEIDVGELNRRGKGLRQVVVSIIWARNKLPGFNVYRPSDVVQLDEMKISVL